MITSDDYTCNNWPVPNCILRNENLTMKRILHDCGHLKEIKKKFFLIRNNINEIMNSRENINNLIAILKEIKICGQS